MNKKHKVVDLWKERFLKYYDGGNAREVSAAMAKVTMSKVYEELRKDSNFKQKYEEIQRNFKPVR